MAPDSRTETTNVEGPDFLLAGIRCGLEMVLVGAILLYLGLPASNTLYLGLVVVATVVAVTVVLFWSVNRQMEIWVARARRTPASDSE